MKNTTPTCQIINATLLPNMVPPEIGRQFLLETYIKNRDFIEPLVLRMLAGMDLYEVFLAQWEDYSGGVFRIPKVGHSIHIPWIARAWMEFCHQPGAAGPICRVNRRQWNAFEKRLLAGKFDITALGNCSPHYDQVHRKGSEFQEGPEAANDCYEAMLFHFLYPEMVLSSVFDEIVDEARRRRGLP